MAFSLDHNRNTKNVQALFKQYNNGLSNGFISINGLIAIPKIYLVR